MIDQQVNLYRAEFRPETNAFRSVFILQATAAVMLALLLIYAFAHQGVAGIDRELKVVAQQETVALERLQNVRPLITSITGELSWSAQLEIASHTLAERQAVLSIIQGSSLGDTKGFSRHLRALSKQHIDGVWLTRILLSPLDERTRIAGRTIRAELIPLYVQNLTADPAFAMQRFQRFEIDNPPDDDDAVLTFSMDSHVFVAGAEGRQP